MRVVLIQAVLAQQDLELFELDLRMVFELGLLVGDLGAEQLILGLAGQERPCAHRHRAGHCLGQPAHEHGRRRRVRAGQAGHDGQRYQQPVLETEHQLADARQAPDPLALGQHAPAQRLPRLRMRAARAAPLGKAGLRDDGHRPSITSRMVGGIGAGLPRASVEARMPARRRY